MSDTKTLIGTLLESFIEEKKGWISEQSMGSLSSQINIVPSLSASGGTYIPAVDGFIRFDVQSFSTTGFAYIASEYACVGITVDTTSMRVCLMCPVTKGKTAYVYFPNASSRSIYFTPLKGQS